MARATAPVMLVYKQYSCIQAVLVNTESRYLVLLTLPTNKSYKINLKLSILTHPVISLLVKPRRYKMQPKTAIFHLRETIVSKTTCLNYVYCNINLYLQSNILCDSPTDIFK